MRTPSSSHSLPAREFFPAEFLDLTTRRTGTPLSYMTLDLKSSSIKCVFKNFYFLTWPCHEALLLIWQKRPKDSESDNWKSKSYRDFSAFQVKAQSRSSISIVLQLKNQVESHQNLENSRKIFKNLWRSYLYYVLCFLDVCNEVSEAIVSMGSWYFMQ